MFANESALSDKTEPGKIDHDRLSLQLLGEEDKARERVGKLLQLRRMLDTFQEYP